MINMQYLSDMDLISHIFKIDEEFAGETLFFLLEEAKNRNLVVSFPNGDIIITREEYNI